MKSYLCWIHLSLVDIIYSRELGMVYRIIIEQWMGVFVGTTHIFWILFYYFVFLNVIGAWMVVKRGLRIESYFRIIYLCIKRRQTNIPTLIWIIQVFISLWYKSSVIGGCNFLLAWHCGAVKQCMIWWRCISCILFAFGKPLPIPSIRCLKYFKLRFIEIYLSYLSSSIRNAKYETYKLSIIISFGLCEKR